MITEIGGIKIPVEHPKFCPCGKAKWYGTHIESTVFKGGEVPSCISCGLSSAYWIGANVGKMTVVEEFDSEGNLVKKTTITEEAPKVPFTPYTSPTWGSGQTTTPKYPYVTYNAPCTTDYANLRS